MLRCVRSGLLWLLRRLFRLFGLFCRLRCRWLRNLFCNDLANEVCADVSRAVNGSEFGIEELSFAQESVVVLMMRASLVMLIDHTSLFHQASSPPLP